MKLRQVLCCHNWHTLERIHQGPTLTRLPPPGLHYDGFSRFRHVFGRCVCLKCGLEKQRGWKEDVPRLDWEDVWTNGGFAEGGYVRGGPMPVGHGVLNNDSVMPASYVRGLSKETLDALHKKGFVDGADPAPVRGGVNAWRREQVEVRVPKPTYLYRVAFTPTDITRGPTVGRKRVAVVAAGSTFQATRIITQGFGVCIFLPTCRIGTADIGVEEIINVEMQ